ncbi:type II secretion system protein GspJ [Gammaproteobacteria bacterium]|nr:type II secretion system protein GspJ [Gammaproteobacteria bacterium]MDB9901452.1 type II secretion system protein GspJ [Gammaproteobacteria bacterium]MDC1277312.1 type II secretion system protein GspJ [Gammaproteobacteria bacterium]MDC1360056.1 type II secretion system protein GspJ [Gammaproteobacteria bacterium]MDC3381911.1 type II secretion system protein GspJ [Gammaproteobacteria bacterium]
MKKNNSVTLGFTLIEVLISIVILSIITIITSTFLQSSINSKNLVFNKSADILQINLFGDRLKQDLVNAVNVPLLDQRGEIMEATFQGDINSKIFSFVTRATSNTLSSKLLVKVQYYLKDNELIRRQFFAASPSSSEDYYETVLFTGVKDIELEFSNGTSWFYFWPQDSFSKKQIPTLVKVVVDMGEDTIFTWIIDPQVRSYYE